jgi:hypothetical protein
MATPETPLSQVAKSVSQLFYWAFFSSPSAGENHDDVKLKKMPNRFK